MIGQREIEKTSMVHWMPIEGRWEIDPESLRYMPVTDEKLQFTHGMAVCSRQFLDGSVSVKVKFASENPQANELTHATAGIVLGHHPETGRYLVAGLGAFDSAFSIFEFVPNRAWISLKSAGEIGNLKFRREYNLDVTLRGQRVALSVDDVPVVECLLQAPLVGNQLGLYARDVEVSFEGFSASPSKPKAFVAMQFGEPYDTLYKQVIEKVGKDAGFEVERIDEVNRPGIIFQDIQRGIEDSQVVIAEITAPNQNVFYEVGFAHALNKPTILLAQRGRDLPFDIRSYRVIFYDDSIGGKPAVEQTLARHLHSILQDS